MAADWRHATIREDEARGSCVEDTARAHRVANCTLQSCDAARRDEVDRGSLETIGLHTPLTMSDDDLRHDSAGHSDRLTHRLRTASVDHSRGPCAHELR